MEDISFPSPTVVALFPATASMSQRSRYSSLAAVYGEDTLVAIRSSRVLVVGAGGIGCEVLKNLVMSGEPLALVSPHSPQASVRSM
jgi:phosphoglycerate dehydrogenase-like enzyme